jgi:Ca-activated chloride channel family protein
MTKKYFKMVAAFVCLLWGGALLGQTPEQISAQAVDGMEEAAQFQLAVEVELVNVVATVLDGQGRYVEGLTADDFTVFEDGAEQEVSFFSHDQQVPVSMGILVDTSGSMRHKLQQSLQVARELAMALSPSDEVFVISFSNNNKVLTEFTTVGPELPEVFRGIRSGGETAVFDAIGLAVEMMDSSARHDKKILLLITDGFDTRSKLRSDDIDELLRRNQVLVYAIGIDDDDSDPEVMRRTRYHVYHYMLALLTDVTGGRAFRLYTGRRYALRSLAEILLEELHQQYTLSYYPSSLANQDWRDIQVDLDRPGATVRHRSGYYMSPSSGADE